MPNNWTDDQLSAINSDGHSLIVSAAAGSGKTAVLVERILRKISGAKKNCNIDNLLIVTFTNAAAAEMKAKISSAIYGLLSENPNNNALRKQLSLLSGAHIETVHAFCLDLIRGNFYRLGISPDFRLADTSESELLKKNAMDRAFDVFYRDIDGKPESRAVYEAFSNGRDDRNLEAAVIELYEKIQSCPYPFDWLDRIEADYKNSDNIAAEQTEWGKYLISKSKRMAEISLSYLKFAASQGELYDELKKAYLPAIYDDMAYAEKILNAGGWDEIFNLCQNYTPAKLGTVRKFEPKSVTERIKACRDVWKKNISAIKTGIINCSSDDAAGDLARLCPTVSGLFALVREFSRQYEDIKLSQNVLDFSDLEHKALELLLKKSGDNYEKTEIAVDLSHKFSEIMVDEYQDTNAVQDLIFSALSREDSNIFTVGDVKQSIYRFRLADPSIFLHKYLNRPDERSAEAGVAARVSMSKNFRSRKNVLDAVNFIFSHVMSPDFGGLYYTDNEALHCGAGYDNADSDDYNTEFCVIDMDSPDDESDEQETVKAEVEADYCARRIAQLMSDGFKITDPDSKKLRPARPEDFTVLLRSMSGKADIYKKAIENLGIPCSTDTAGEFFSTIEITSVVSFLSVLNNSANDVDLISVMRSPVYSFTADELAALRAEHKDAPFNRVVFDTAERNPDSKCASMVSDIRYFTRYSADFPLSKTLWHIYNRLNLTAIFAAFENGRNRVANLMALFEFSKGFDNLGLGALPKFLSVLEQMRTENKLPSSIINSSGTGVKIMSIHKSKGLEFPIVIVPDCAKQFNNEDIKKAMLFDNKLGIGLRVKDEASGAQYPSAVRTAIAQSIKEASLSEELRVLYVALTRAKEKLIITMAVPSAAKAAQKWSLAVSAAGFHPQTFLSQNSPAAFIAMPMLLHADAEPLRELSEVEIHPETAPFSIDIKHIRKTDGIFTRSPDLTVTPQTQSGKISDEQIRAAVDNLDKPYVFEQSCATPAKVTPTMLRKIGGHFTCVTRQTPRLLNTEQILSAQISPTERGIAHHLAMQYVQFDKCRSIQGVRGEIQRLRDNQILSEAQASAVSAEKLYAFFESEIGQRIFNCERLIREFKFSLLCDCSMFFEDNKTGDEIMLQGVIDCIFEEPDGIVIVDFKSDRVRAGKESVLAEKYRPQIEAYSYAARRITGKPVKQCALYFFDTDRTVFI